MYVSVSYEIASDSTLEDLKDGLLDRKLWLLAKSLGGIEVGSGLGLGSRDLEFEFNDAANADKFLNQCIDSGFDANMYEDDDDDDLEGECKCEYCSGKTPEERESARQRIDQEEEALLAKYGYFIHSVFDDPNAPYGWNFHTHGLCDRGLTDLQLVAPLDPNVAAKYLNFVAGKLLDGQTLVSGDVITYLTREQLDDYGAKDWFNGGDYRLKLVAAVEGERHVLRIILPDVNGNLDEEDMVLFYSHQYDGVLKTI